MDIIRRISFLINDMDSGATTTGNVAQNLAKGHVDIVGGKCPDGQVYDTKKQVCVPIKNIKEEGEFAYSYNQKLVTMLRMVKDGIMSMDEAAGKMATMFNVTSEKIMGDFRKVIKGKEAKNEASVVGGSYVGGTTINIIGSGQTRTWGPERRRGLMLDLSRKEKLNVIGEPDKTKENISRMGLKFDSGSGAYVPMHWLMSQIGDE